MSRTWATGNTVDATAMNSLESRVGRGVFNVKDQPYNATGDGSTDDLAAINAAIAACQTAGGGEVYFPAGTYYCSAPLTMPTIAGGTSDGIVRPMIFRGAGAQSEGSVSQQSTPGGGTVLKIADGGVTTGGKITCIGAGQLEITGISFMEPATGGALPFLYSTSTVLRVHHCAFWGYSTKGNSSSTQDAIVLGGLNGGSSPATNGTYGSPFQGYGTSITECAFHKVARIVYGRSWCNGVMVRDNWVSHNCGNSSTTTVCIEILGVSTSFNNGWTVTGNAVECLGYTYFLKADYLTQCFLGPNNLYDEPAGFTAAYRMEANATFNSVVEGCMKGTKTLLSEHATSTGKNMAISQRQAANAIVIPQDSYIKFGSHADARMYSYNDRIITPGNLEATGHGWFGSLGVGNSAAATTPGSVVKKIQVYDAAGASLGFIPVYNTIA